MKQFLSAVNTRAVMAMPIIGIDDGTRCTSRRYFSSLHGGREVIVVRVLYPGKAVDTWSRWEITRPA